MMDERDEQKKQEDMRFFDALYRLVALSEARSRIPEGEPLGEELRPLLPYVDELENMDDRARAEVIAWAGLVGQLLRTKALLIEAEKVVQASVPVRDIVDRLIGELSR